MKGSAKDNGVIEWSDPPPRGRPRSEPPPYLEALQAFPGRWGLVEKGRLPDGKRHIDGAGRLKRHGLQVSVRTSPDGSYRVWARWPAEESQVAESAS